MNDRFEMMKFFDGARMAYDDCAALAEHLAAHSEGFAAYAAAAGHEAPLNPHLVEAVELAGKVILESFAKTIREKRAEMDRLTSFALTGEKQVRSVQ